MTPDTWKPFRFAAAALAAALVLVACGGDGGGGGGEGATEAVLLTAFTEPQDVAGVEALIEAFEEANPGTTITHQGSSDFEQQALTQIEGGNAPDLMFHPQPGLLGDFVERGAPRPLDFLDTATIEDEFVAGLLDLGTFDDTLYGLQTRVSLKSLVWYPQEEFEAAGYEVPETWDDMVALSDRIAGDLGDEAARAPWCIGIESGEATGWPSTDWLEDIMLRLHGAEVYDQWTSGELDFTSEEVRSAYERLAEIWFEEEWVLGGRRNIVATNFAQSVLPMFDDPPGCFLHRQASFIQNSFPDGAELGTDFGFFFVPPIEDGGTGEAPALIAGDLLALYTDNQVAKDFIAFAATTEAQEAWAAEGSFICANTNCDTSVYPNEALTQQAELVAEADVARFDGSDLMPGAVGANAFWKENVAWVTGSQELETTLENIEAAWPDDE